MTEPLSAPRPRIILGSKDREREAITRLLRFYAPDCDILIPEDEARKVVGGFPHLGPPRDGDVWVECHPGGTSAIPTFRAWAAKDMAARGIAYTVTDHHGTDDPELEWVFGMSSLGQIVVWLAETGRLDGRPGLATGLVYHASCERGVWFMDPYINNGAAALVHINRNGMGFGGWLHRWDSDGGAPLDLLSIGESDHNRAAFLSPGMRPGMSGTQEEARAWAERTLAEEMGMSADDVRARLAEAQAMIARAPCLPGTEIKDLREIPALTPPAPGVPGQGGTHWRFTPDAACLGGYAYVGWGTQGYNAETGLRHINFGGAGEGTRAGVVDFHPILRSLGCQRTYPPRIARGIGGGYAPWSPVE